MATAESVKTKIQNLINRANATTQKADTNLSEAVDSLVSGYGQGDGITPSGEININENGTYDVTEKATAVVSVDVPIKVLAFSLDSDISNGTHTLVSGDDFVKAHYSDDGFFAILIRQSGATAAANNVPFIYQGNRAMVTAGSYTYYGLAGYDSSASTFNGLGIVGKLSAGGYNQTMQADSSGKVEVTLSASRIVPAGKYLMILGVGNV